MSDELKIAIEAAKIGAKKALQYFDKPLKITKKQDSSIVSKADSETEEVIKRCILSKDKKAKFLDEESGGNKSEKRLWIIDPIDGTRLFVRGIQTGAF